MNVQLRVRRSGDLFDCEITPFVFKGRRIPSPLSQWEKDLQDLKENYPDWHHSPDYLIEEGDLVACIGSTTGTNRKFSNRPFAFSQAFVFRFADGKIVSIFEVRNQAVERVQQGYRILPPEE